jgi:alcohol dehydrogenase class IV
VKRGTHTFPPTERVHFGTGSLQEVGKEARRAERVFVVTGRTLDEKTDLVRRVEGILGERHAGTFAGMGPAHRVARLVEELGLPNRLRDLGVPEGDLDRIAAEYGEREEDARGILHSAY